MKKTYDEKILSAYIDGELDDTNMKEVEMLLEMDKEAVRYVLDMVRTTARLRADANAVLQEEIPQRLLDTLSPKQVAKSRRKPAIRSLYRVAAVLILGFLGFGIGLFMERDFGESYPSLIAPLPASYSNVVNAALEFNLSGKSHEWRDPRRSIAVKVTPVKTYRNKDGVFYREYKMEVASDSQQSKISGLAYRTAKGQWTTKVLYF